MTTFIYVLKDPFTGVVRYVGKANDPEARFSFHLRDRTVTHKTNWIKSLKTRPLLEVIDEIPVSEWPMWEAAYIQYFQEQGCGLVNGTVGGDGIPNPSLEIRKKIGESNRLNFSRNPETRLRMSRASTGRVPSPAQREKISRALRGRVVSSEHRKNLSRALVGKVVSDSTRNKIRRARATQKMSSWTSERREKIQKTWERKKCQSL